MTVDEIARELNVSKSTVSRALSGKGRISESTRSKIRLYAQEHGRDIDKKVQEYPKCRSIAVLIPEDAYSTSIPFFHESLLGISEVAALHGFDVMIVVGSTTDITSVQMIAEKKRADGVILLRGIKDDRALKYLEEKDLPVGLIGTCEYDNIIQVDVDNREAAETLVTSLINQGYRKFAMVVGNTTFRVNRERSEGYFRALAKAGLPASRQLYYPNFVNLELNEGIINDVFSKKAECLICGDELICTRLMSRLQTEGYWIPRDIAVVSMYNNAFLECLSPAVTAINISARRMGNVIAKQMIDRLQGRAFRQKTMLDYEILNRKSSRKTMDP